MRYRVEPQVGRYIVRRANGIGYVTRVVTKDKKCSCGGDAENPCVHIEAVREYLLDGGKKAEPFKKVLPDEPAGVDRITVCPICGEKVEWARSHRYPLMWRCPDSSHYWDWYGRKHKVRAFMTEHHTGIPAIDEMTTEEYAAFLDEQERIRYETPRTNG